eukprot:383256-Amphidinium_carterae.2
MEMCLQRMCLLHDRFCPCLMCDLLKSRPSAIRHFAPPLPMASNHPACKRECVLSHGPAACVAHALVHRMLDVDMSPGDPPRLLGENGISFAPSPKKSTLRGCALRYETLESVRVGLRLERVLSVVRVVATNECT